LQRDKCVKLFLTSATGYVGRAVAAEFVARGHRVTALARSAASRQKLESAGVSAVPGDLRNPAAFVATISQADVVVHTAFEYLPDGSENREVDCAVTRAMLCELARAGGARQFIYTSNVYLSQISIEAPVEPSADDQTASHSKSWRLSLEREVLAAADGGLRTAVVRPGMVYGGNDGGTVADLLRVAARDGFLSYPESCGGNRWSLITLQDLARLYVAVAEQRAGGVFHGVDGAPATVADVMRAVSDACGVGCSIALEPQQQLDPHTRDLMQRDAAFYAERSNALGWRPEIARFGQDLARLVGG
jgi:nucleoside-diphosphate-sugar epimerase